MPSSTQAIPYVVGSRMGAQATRHAEVDRRENSRPSLEKPPTGDPHQPSSWPSNSSLLSHKLPNPGTSTRCLEPGLQASTHVSQDSPRPPKTSAAAYTGIPLHIRVKRILDVVCSEPIPPLQLAHGKALSDGSTLPGLVSRNNTPWGMPRLFGRHRRGLGFACADTRSGSSRVPDLRAIPALTTSPGPTSSSPGSAPEPCPNSQRQPAGPPTQGFSRVGRTEEADGRWPGRCHVAQSRPWPKKSF